MHTYEAIGTMLPLPDSDAECMFIIPRGELHMGTPVCRYDAKRKTLAVNTDHFDLEGIAELAKGVTSSVVGVYLGYQQIRFFPEVRVLRPLEQHEREQQSRAFIFMYNVGMPGPGAFRMREEP